jgi:hypothetical protein
MDVVSEEFLERQMRVGGSKYVPERIDSLPRTSIESNNALDPSPLATSLRLGLPDFVGRAHRHCRMFRSSDQWR